MILEGDLIFQNAVSVGGVGPKLPDLSILRGPKKYIVYLTLFFMVFFYVRVIGGGGVKTTTPYLTSEKIIMKL